MTAATPKAPTAPYAASATAAPMPVARPTAVPWFSVRWITSRPIGPTGAAIASPTSMACSSTTKPVSMGDLLQERGRGASRIAGSTGDGAVTFGSKGCETWLPIAARILRT
jgi:hypothetical protein